MSDLFDLIGKFGLPIVFCVLSFWLIYKMLSQYSTHILKQSSDYLNLINLSVNQSKQGDNQLYKYIIELQKTNQRQNTTISDHKTDIMVLKKQVRDIQKFLEKTTTYKEITLDIEDKLS